MTQITRTIIQTNIHFARLETVNNELKMVEAVHSVFGELDEKKAEKALKKAGFKGAVVSRLETIEIKYQMDVEKFMSLADKVEVTE